MAYKYNEKERQNKKEYYQKNKERIQKRMQLYSKKWYQKNKEKVRLQHKEYYQKNREKRTRYHEEWYQRNREKRLQQCKKYYQKNREKIQWRQRKYSRENKEKILRYKGKWQKYKRKTDPKYRLNENIGTAIWVSLKDKKAGRKWETLVDFALKELIECLERQFDNKMNWDNYGSYWVIDHVKPKSLFNYISPDDLEFKQCWDLKNLQPLEKIENIKKGNHYIS
ncbi:MAG: hypothetical protein KJI70_02295 [Patescibacteria group bacterium]|nr:hypothetical protein [Patescibacteria group bacterium]